MKFCLLLLTRLRGEPISNAAKTASKSILIGEIILDLSGDPLDCMCVSAKFGTRCFSRFCWIGGLLLTILVRESAKQHQAIERRLV